MAPFQLTNFKAAIDRDDVPGAGEILAREPALAKRINDGLFSWGKPPVAASRSLKMAELLIGHGARPAEVGRWWAPGFGTDEVLPEVGEYLLGLGAKATPHALAGLGLAETLRRLIEKRPGSVAEKGGDGCRPLHFARTVDVARILADAGAEIDARDDDHDSTPAQWRIGSAEAVSRFLVERGAIVDIFLAAALGDRDRAGRLVESDPACTGYRIGRDKGPFPGIGFKAPGGTIYQWTLGFNLMPQEIAYRRGYIELFDLLMLHTPVKNKLLVACAIADRTLAESIVRDNPGIVGEMDDEDLSLLATWCWETNQNVEGVRLMLAIGFPVDRPEHKHGYSPLHNAAWCGNAELVELLLKHGHPVELQDPRYGSTPLGWAIHGCVTEKRHPEDLFPPVAELLLNAGASFDMHRYPTGNASIDALLARRFR